MDTQNIPDLHNRRRNLEVVSRWCKENNYPLLVWPEDKAILRLDDLPNTEYLPNKPSSWGKMEFSSDSWINQDETLRNFIRVGFAYSFTGFKVQEWLVKSK